MIVPATAHAATPAVQHQRAAKVATLRLADAVANGNHRAALRALRASRREAAAAAAATGALAGDALRAARVARATALTFDSNIASYSALLDDADPAVARRLAESLVPAMAGRAGALNALEI